jgi:hypothetical protein
MLKFVEPGENLVLFEVSYDTTLSNVAIVFFFMLYDETCSINIDKA